MTTSAAFADDTLQLLTQDYLRLLLAGNRAEASQLVLNAREQGCALKDIYLGILQPALREVGELWHVGQISVAQEHFCSAATQMVMSQLYPWVFRSDKINRSLVAACVPQELHEIGIRMVADLFEVEGWHTYFTGANTPSSSLVATIEERQADVVAISATIPQHIPSVMRLIEAIRATDYGQRVKIMVGGYPFNLSADLWQRVGADAFAADAYEAVRVGNRLVDDSRLDR